MDSNEWWLLSQTNKRWQEMGVPATRIYKGKTK